MVEVKKLIKKVRNLQIYLVSFSLLLTGCSIHLEKETTKNSKSDKVIVSEQEENNLTTRVLSDEKNSGISNYFNRTYRSRADYDEMILTLEEKGIRNLSDEAKKTIQNVSLYNTNPYDFSWVELFSIDECYQSVYTNSNVASRIKNHHNNEFYNALNDSIRWDTLLNRILDNSTNKAKKEEDLSPLSETDITIILSQLRDFVSDVKKDYPAYDMGHLACQLASLSLNYRLSQESGSHTLASTTYAGIEWYLNEQGEKPVFTTSIMLNEHEFKHFLCSYCRDEITNTNVYITPSGVIYGNNTSLSFSFIEEATAEEYAAKRNNGQVVTYYEKIAALDTIRFVLSLQDDYEEDGFLKYGFLQNPLALVQQFPVLEDQTYYFKNNLKMLASYNACLSSIPTIFSSSVKEIPGYEDFYHNIDQRKEILSSLGTYASSELSRLFLTNLVVMNDTKDTMTIDYNFYLMKLFEKRMDILFSAMTDFQKINISSANYKQIYQERLGSLFQYLSSKYKMDLGAMKELYQEYSLQENINYPTFVSNSKRAFYQELESIDYDSDTLKENSDNQLQYYVQYSTR